MMEADNTSQDSTANQSECPSVTCKKTSLTNGTADEEAAEVKTPLLVMPENGLSCNGTVGFEDLQNSSQCKESDEPENLPNVVTSTLSKSSDKEGKQKSEPSEHVKILANESENSVHVRDASDVSADGALDSEIGGPTASEKVSGDEQREGHQNDCDMEINEDKIAQLVEDSPSRTKPGGLSSSVSKSEVDCDKKHTRSSRKRGNQVAVIEVERDATKGATDIRDVRSFNEVKDTADIEDDVVLLKEEEANDSCVNVNEQNSAIETSKHAVKNTDSKGDKTLTEDMNIEVQNDDIKDKCTTDSERIADVIEEKVDSKIGKKVLPQKGMEVQKTEKSADSSVDDIEIIGESRVNQAKKPDRCSPRTKPKITPKIAPVPSGPPLLNQGLTVAGVSRFTTPSMHNPHLARSIASNPVLQGFTAGRGAHGIPVLPPGFGIPGGMPSHSPQNIPLIAPPVAPPKPKSSLDQIELIRWEIQNRISTRPKYFKPNPSSELGPLAKFLFDIGGDLIKEAVYHDLVKIQSKKNNNDKLSDKEKQDLCKLKEIEKDLYATVGHLKLKLKKRCKVCNFHTESENVMFYHKQYPHEDNKFLRCAHCSFATKQAVAFKFHLESEHSVQPKLHDKKAFYECDLCPYENNQEQKLNLHKQRCIKQFRPLFNLHPSCLSGAEINLCLENIFYKPLVPKNLKFLQQKHAQQQAALAEARRQQAEIQALAAVKKPAAAPKKQQLQPRGMATAASVRYNIPPSGVPMQQNQPVRFNANTKGPRLTVANMLNNKQNPLALPTGASPNAAPSGFEVCEICGGYVKDRKALRIHFFYAHRIDLPVNLFERTQAPLYCATCYVRFWTAQGLRKHIDTHKEENQTRGVVGKCISCGHHVLNLLLHMRVVHNRELHHYINALVCMFCGGHFSSRQECEKHIPKVHGQVDPISGTLKSPPSVPIQQQQQPQPQLQKAPAVNQKKMGNNSLVKGSVCVLCNLNFGRNVDLTRHCMRMHHTCMKCGMVVIDKASLMKHTCLSSASGTRDCSLCGETGFHPAYYVKHLRDKHLRKFTINVSKLSKEIIARWTKCPVSDIEPAEILVEISDSDDDVVLSKRKSSSPIVTSSRKRPRIGPASKIGRSCSGTPTAATEVSTDKQEQDIVPAATNDVVPIIVDDVDTVKDLSSTKKISCADEDSRSDGSPRGEKRKSESPKSEKSPKRKISS